MAANMKEIKERIDSVKSTSQITNAMNIVSSTKFKRFQVLTLKSRSYARAVNEAFDNKFEYVYDRSKLHKARDKYELGISAVRGGSIVGEHDVIFAGEDEVITFSHSAYSRNIFAKGAIAAARYLAKKESGLYTMADVISQ